MKEYFSDILDYTVDENSVYEKNGNWTIIKVFGFCSCGCLGTLNENGLLEGYGEAWDCGHLIEKDNISSDKDVEQGQDTFEGYYVNGKRHGKGVYHFADGDFIEGIWADGTPVSGEYHFSATINSKEISYIYRGNFIKDAENGEKYYPNNQGEVEYENGDIYSGGLKGGWSSLQKDGVGELKKADGTVQKGKWSSDKLVCEE